MSTSVYISNTDRCFFILLLLSINLVFSLRLILRVLLLYASFADYVACKWRHSLFVTLIINIMFLVGQQNVKCLDLKKNSISVVIAIKTDFARIRAVVYCIS